MYVSSRGLHTIGITTASTYATTNNTTTKSVAAKIKTEPKHMYLSCGWRSSAMRHGNHERRHKTKQKKHDPQSPNADAIEGAAEPCRLDGPTDSAWDIRGKPFVDEGAIDP